MERYELFYREIFLGILQVDGQGRHCYIPDAEGTVRADVLLPLNREIRDGTDGFGDPIPFFQCRLRDMQRWNLTEINYQTDWFLLRRCE